MFDGVLKKIRPIIVELHQKHNARVFLVGGTIRDFLLGIESHDFDLVVEGISEADLREELAKFGYVIPIEGRTFGVIKFKPEVGQKSEVGGQRTNHQTSNLLPQTFLDIALPRREWYEVGQRRKNAVVETENMTINDDLARRDFTINAMAADLSQIGKLVESKKSKENIGSHHPISKNQYPINDQHSITNNQLEIKNWKLPPHLSSPQAGEELSEVGNYLIDPFDGLKDLKDGIVRAVGNPLERFKEDPTRILRGIRFAVRFGFNIEPETLQAMKDLASEILKKFTTENGVELERVSFEMIGEEFLRALITNPLRTIELYDEVGLLKLLFPELEAEKNLPQPPQFHMEGDVFAHTKLALSKLSNKTSIEVKLGVLFHDIGKVYTFRSEAETGDRIRFNNHDVVGAEKIREILRRLKYPSKLIDDVAWLVQNHMKMAFSFSKMRLDKKKRFARHRLFPKLIELVCAAAAASIYKDGTTSCSFLKPAEEILHLVNEERKAKKPEFIINGNEIIEILKKKIPDFDPRKNGRIIGKFKEIVNSRYDLGEIKTKEEAARWVLKNYRMAKTMKFN